MAAKRELRKEISKEIKRLKTENDASTAHNSKSNQDDDHELSQDSLIIQDDCLDPQPNERYMMHIGGDIYVVAKTYNNQLQIHVRQFNRYDTQLYPTKKGVTLTLSRWRMLEFSQKDLDKYFEDYLSGSISEEHSIHLGGGIYVTVNNKFPVINIRHWWKPNDETEPKPTKRGLILNRDKWSLLKDVMTLIRDFVPELNDASIGCDEEDHQNQLGMLRCRECNPFDYVNY